MPEKFLASRSARKTLRHVSRLLGDQVLTLVDASANATSVRFAIGGQTLAYVASDAGTRTLALADRQGNRRPLANLPNGNYESPRVSPKGDRVAVLRNDLNDEQRDLWIYDLSASRLAPLTRSGGISGPAWSADGLRVAYLRGQEALWRNLDASSDEELLIRRPRRFGALSLTPDILVFQEGTGAWDIGIAAIGKPGSDSLILRGDYWEGHPEVSPDGRWLAYYSGESGRAQIFVQPFLRPGRKVLISPEGGLNPRWAGDGQRLFYIQGGAVNEASLTIGTDVAVKSVRRLFEVAGVSTGTPQYDVFPDGNRFAITELQSTNAPREVTIVHNFWQLLRRK